MVGHEEWNELYHQGVKGMRWGVIRDRDRPKGSTSSPKELSPKKQKARDDLVARKNSLNNDISALSMHGIKSEVFTKKYPSLGSSDIAFMMTHGATKEKALKNLLAQKTRERDAVDKDLKAVESGKLTSKQKKIIGAVAVAGVLAAGAGAYYYKNANFNSFMEQSNTTKLKKALDGSMDLETLRKLSDEDIKLPKGQIFKRMSMDKEETLRSKLYASFDEDDITRYKSALPKYWEQWSGKAAGKKGYEVTIEAVNDIVSPSHKKRVDLFMETMDASFPLPSGQVVKGRDYILSQAGQVNLFGAQNPEDLIFITGQAQRSVMKNLTNEEIAAQVYNNFASNQVMDNAFNKEYFKRVTEAGYNAIVDDNDAGSLAKTPMILLETEKNLRRVGAEVLTPEMIKQARKTVKKL